jgi:hypothetical protein
MNLSNNYLNTTSEALSMNIVGGGNSFAKSAFNAYTNYSFMSQACCICLCYTCIFIFGIMAEKQSRKYAGRTIGNITEVDCFEREIETETTSGRGRRRRTEYSKSKRYDCNNKYEYNIDGNQYSTQLKQTDLTSKPSVNSETMIGYVKHNPTDIALNVPPPNTGIGMMLFALCCGCCLLYTLKACYENDTCKKGFAAMSAVSDAKSLLGRRSSYDYDY